MPLLLVEDYFFMFRVARDFSEMILFLPSWDSGSAGQVNKFQQEATRSPNLVWGTPDEKNL